MEAAQNIRFAVFAQYRHVGLIDHFLKAKFAVTSTKSRMVNALSLHYQAGKI